jgi:hypothetical protein
MMKIQFKSQIAHILIHRRKNTKLRCAKILRRTDTVDTVINADLLTDTPSFLVKTNQKTILTELRNVFHFGTMEYARMELDASSDTMNLQNRLRIFCKFAIGPRISHNSLKSNQVD